MIDLTCRLCAGSGVYDFSPSKENLRYVPRAWEIC